MVIIVIFYQYRLTFTLEYHYLTQQRKLKIYYLTQLLTLKIQYLDPDLLLGPAD